MFHFHSTLSRSISLSINGSCSIAFSGNQSFSDIEKSIEEYKSHLTLIIWFTRTDTIDACQSCKWISSEWESESLQCQIQQQNVAKCWLSSCFLASIRISKSNFSWCFWYQYINQNNTRLSLFNLNCIHSRHTFFFAFTFNKFINCFLFSAFLIWFPLVQFNLVDGWTHFCTNFNLNKR